MFDLLLDEKDYREAIEELRKFAEQENIEFDGSSESIVEIAATVLIALELDDTAIAMLTKLVYNIGYRDNMFKSPYIH